MMNFNDAVFEAKLINWGDNAFNLVAEQIRMEAVKKEYSSTEELRLTMIEELNRLEKFFKWAKIPKLKPDSSFDDIYKVILKRREVVEAIEKQQQFEEEFERRELERESWY